MNPRLHPIRTCFIILRRELLNFFTSWTGYGLLTGSAFLNGLSFVILLLRLIDEPTVVPASELYFATPFYWLVALLAAPLITMRMFAQEKFSGTFETLMTAPVTDTSVVIGKFVAAWLFFMLIWVPVPVYMYALAKVSGMPELFKLPSAVGMFVGTGLLGAAFVSIGCWASALTRSQILAAVIALAGNMTLFLASFIGGKFMVSSKLATQIVDYINIVSLLQDYAKGIVDTRLIVYCSTLTTLFLTLTVVVVGSRKWK